MERNRLEREDLDQVAHRYSSRMGMVRNQRDSPAKVRRKRNYRGALDFNNLAAEGNRFVNMVAEEIGCDRARAARITRAVLHGLRDRLPPDDSIEFAQGLPMALKGVWLDQYDLSRTPVITRSAEEFLELIEDRAGWTIAQDFPTANHTIFAVRAVFRALEDTVDMGQLDQIKRMLGRDTVQMLESTGRY